MPNKHWDMETDMIPETTDTYNLGTSQKKWIVNGYELNDACAKEVDTSIEDESESTNLPTTAAVVEFVSDRTCEVSVVGRKLIID